MNQLQIPSWGMAPDELDKAGKRSSPEHKTRDRPDLQFRVASMGTLSYPYLVWYIMSGVSHCIFPFAQGGHNVWQSGLDQPTSRAPSRKPLWHVPQYSTYVVKIPWNPPMSRQVHKHQWVLAFSHGLKKKNGCKGKKKYLFIHYTDLGCTNAARQNKKHEHASDVMYFEMKPYHQTLQAKFLIHKQIN